MASNVFGVNVYQINQRVFPRDSPQKIYFPTTGCLIYDVSASPTRSLSSGYNVYGMLRIAAPAAANSFGDEYYCAETAAQLATLANA